VVDKVLREVMLVGVTGVLVVVPRIAIIIREIGFLDKVMTVVRRLMTGNRVAGAVQEKQETRIVNVTEVTV
jgi:hypothetical protein